MDITSWTIKYNRTSIILFLFICLLGWQQFNNMPRLEDPEFTIRTAVVVTPFAGASPQKVERLVTDLIEEEVRTLPGLKELDSQSLNGLSIVNVTLEDSIANVDEHWIKLRNRIDKARALLPQGVGEPQVNDEFGDVYGEVIALTGEPGYSYRELKDWADVVKQDLYKVKNVSKIQLYGTQEERIYIDFSSSYLKETGVTPFQIAAYLQEQNAIISSGTSEADGLRLTLETTGEFQSLDQIRKFSFRLPGSSETVYLEDIARITRGYVEPASSFVRYNGKPAVVLAISMSPEGNVVDLSEGLQRGLQEVLANVPVGIEAAFMIDQAIYVDRSIKDFTVNLLQAFGLVFITILLFAGVRMGLIVSALVPITMFGCLALMPMFGVKLQSMSIASLIIAMGMLVDNGVVVSESIMVQLAKGKDRLAACSQAVAPLRVPLLIASATTIFAYMPIGTAQSGVGEYCISLFIVVSIALVLSWIFSQTVIPLLCFYFLKVKEEQVSFSSWGYKTFRSLLVYCLKLRGIFALIILGLFVLAAWGFGKVDQNFFPANEREQFLIDVWEPYGTDISVTEETVKQVESFLLEQPELSSLGSFIGNGGPRWYLSLNTEQDNPNYGFMVVTAKSYPEMQDLVDRLRVHVASQFPASRIRIAQLEKGPPVGYPIQIRVRGKDMKELYALKDRLAELLSKTEGVANVHDDWGDWRMQLEVDVNQNQAQRYGLTSRDIGLSLQTQFSGYKATELREGTESIPVILRYEDKLLSDPGRVRDLIVYSSNVAGGGGIPLSAVATPRLEWLPSNIRRKDEVRTMTIKADVLGRSAVSVMTELNPHMQTWQDAADWPAGYSIEVGGENEDSAEAQASINKAMPLAFGCIVLVLIGQFNSIRRLLIILLTIPPMMIGITPGMLITNAAFGFMAMLGMLSLIGILVNNSIMLIDQIELKREEGASLQDSIVYAALRRSRPIIMSAGTTVLGLLPLSLTGGEFWRPMANLMISGLLFSTMLTLILCPVLYSLFFRTRFRGYEWNEKRVVGVDS